MNENTTLKNINVGLGSKGQLKSNLKYPTTYKHATLLNGMGSAEQYQTTGLYAVFSHNLNDDEWILCGEVQSGSKVQTKVGLNGK